jgi:hypothetical protein
MSKLEKLTKQQLIDLNEELIIRLKEVEKYEVEKSIESESSQPLIEQALASKAFGFHKDDKGNYVLTEISFDANLDLARITQTTPLNSKMHTQALYEGKKYLVTKVLNGLK